MYRLTGLILSLAFLQFFSGCETINPSEELPAYITVQNAKVLLNESTNFTSDIGIKDVWVYQGGRLQGVYELPITFPYLDLETTEFYLRGGVYESGLSAFHIPYPFWEREYYTVDQSPGDTLVLEPEFKYFNSSIIDFPVNENFEQQDVNFAPFAYFAADTTRLTKTANEVYRGSRAGWVRFDDDSRHFEVATINPNPLNLDPNVDTYVEITYKSDIPFQVGLIYSNTTEGVGVSPAVTVLPKGDWNTIYVHLIDQIRERRDLNTAFNLWLYAKSDGQEANLYLDDIRLVRFQ